MISDSNAQQSYSIIQTTTTNNLKSKQKMFNTDESKFRNISVKLTSLSQVNFFKINYIVVLHFVRIANKKSVITIKWITKEQRERKEEKNAKEQQTTGHVRTATVVCFVPGHEQLDYGNTKVYNTFQLLSDSRISIVCFPFIYLTITLLKKVIKSH